MASLFTEILGLFSLQNQNFADIVNLEKQKMLETFSSLGGIYEVGLTEILGWWPGYIVYSYRYDGLPSRV